MPSLSWPYGPVCPALDDVNDRIRHLMDEPASTERTRAYALLLALWREVTDTVPAEPAQ